MTKKKTEKNRIKILVLRALSRESGTARDLSRRLKEEVHNVSNTLLRLRRYRCVSRTKQAKGKPGPFGLKRVYFYMITEKGRVKLKFIAPGPRRKSPKHGL